MEPVSPSWRPYARRGRDPVRPLAGHGPLRLRRWYGATSPFRLGTYQASSRRSTGWRIARPGQGDGTCRRALGRRSLPETEPLRDRGVLPGIWRCQPPERPHWRWYNWGSTGGPQSSSPRWSFLARRRLSVGRMDDGASCTLSVVVPTRSEEPNVAALTARRGPLLPLAGSTGSWCSSTTPTTALRTRSAARCSLTRRSASCTVLPGRAEAAWEAPVSAGFEVFAR